MTDLANYKRTVDRYGNPHLYEHVGDRLRARANIQYSYEHAPEPRTLSTQALNDDRYCWKCARATAHTPTSFQRSRGRYDYVERCKTCDVVLFCGDLTIRGTQDALGFFTPDPVAFVASIDMLTVVARAFDVTTMSATYVKRAEVRAVWFTQVLRHQPWITRDQCDAFEAAWTANQRDVAFTILRSRSLGNGDPGGAGGLP